MGARLNQLFTGCHFLIETILSVSLFYVRYHVVLYNGAKIVQPVCFHFRNKTRSSLIILSTDELNLKELQVEAWVVSLSLGDGRTPPCFVRDRFGKEKKDGISV